MCYNTGELEKNWLIKDNFNACVVNTRRYHFNYRRWVLWYYFCRWVKPTKNTWPSLVLVFYTDVTLGQFFTVLFCVYFFKIPYRCHQNDDVNIFFFNTFWKDAQHFHYYILIEKSLIFCFVFIYLFKSEPDSVYIL